MSEERLRALDDADLAKQSWIIQASLALVGSSRSVESSIESAAGAQAQAMEPPSNASKDDLVAHARAIGDRLFDLAICNSGRAQWLGVVFSGSQPWFLAPLNPNLYDGLAGVALFLATLGTVTQEERYGWLARQAARSIRAIVASAGGHLREIGAYEGWGGLIYTWAHLGRIWNDPEFWDEAEGFVSQFEDGIERDTALDVVGGAAGCALSLLALYGCSGSKIARRAGIRCGERLIQTALPMPQGVGWQTPIRSTQPLLGWSHGAGGIASALLELSQMTGEDRFQKSALAALEYERSEFRPDVGNWPDFREIAGGFPIAWCHGAPGIGLSRRRMMQHLDDPRLSTEIEVAVCTTHSSFSGWNHSLCHGDLGNLELILETDHYSLPVVTSQILNQKVRYGWRFGPLGGLELPGFMTGLAGIGYALLRIADRAMVPSVLMLDPPRNDGSSF